MPRQADTETPKDLVERIAGLLTTIDETGDVPDEIKDRPGEFLRELYEAWYENGGKAGGKPRNSIRRMRNEWLVGEKAVPSLHPKLQGEVKLGRKDANLLTGLFLSRWKYVGSRQKDAFVTHDGYIPFQSKDLPKLKGMLINAIFEEYDREHNTTVLLPKSKNDNGESHLAVQNYKTFVHAADAIITVSSRKTIIAPIPQEGMRIWWHLVNNFFDEESTRDNIFIWIIDIGSRQVEDEGSFDYYYNSGILALHFSTFANFGSALDRDRSNSGPISRRLSLPDDRKRLERWQWLREHAAIVVRSRGHSEVETLYHTEDEHLRAIRLQHDSLNVEHLLPRTVPSIWAKSLEYLYQTTVNDLEEATLSVAYKKTETQAINIRYLAAANIIKKALNTSNIDDKAWSVGTVELPSPGNRYDEAYHLAYYASLYRLGRDKENLDTKFAMAFLKKSGFEVLRVDDFIKIFGVVENLPPENVS